MAMGVDATEGTEGAVALRFTGEEEDGSALGELHAADLAQVLHGVVGLASDFAKAGVFGEGTAGAEVMVRPPRSGSFIIDVVAAGSVIGVPSLGQIIWWATRSVRAEVSGVEYLENGNVKVTWQDNTVQEIPVKAWQELNKRDRRRKKQLREIMAPMGDPRVSSVELQPGPDVTEAESAETFTLTQADYRAVRPDDEISEREDTFETEAQMSAIDFDNPKKWRVKTLSGTRSATVEDRDFLARVAGGLAIRKTDIFRLTVREDTVEKNGRTRRKWTVMKVESHRRTAGDDDT